MCVKLSLGNLNHVPYPSHPTLKALILVEWPPHQGCAVVSKPFWTTRNLCSTLLSIESHTTVKISWHNLSQFKIWTNTKPKWGSFMAIKSAVDHVDNLTCISLSYYFWPFYKERMWINFYCLNLKQENQFVK